MFSGNHNSFFFVNVEQILRIIQKMKKLDIRDDSNISRKVVFS